MVNLFKTNAFNAFIADIRFYDTAHKKIVR